jgi:hypothetical protein
LRGMNLAQTLVMPRTLQGEPRGCSNTCVHTDCSTQNPRKDLSRRRMTHNESRNDSG